MNGINNKIFTKLFPKDNPKKTTTTLKTLTQACKTDLKNLVLTQHKQENLLSQQNKILSENQRVSQLSNQKNLSNQKRQSRLNELKSKFNDLQNALNDTDQVYLKQQARLKDHLQSLKDEIYDLEGQIHSLQTNTYSNALDSLQETTQKVLKDFQLALAHVNPQVPQTGLLDDSKLETALEKLKDYFQKKK